MTEHPTFPGGGRYRKLAPTLRERFGERVQKVTLRGGFGCPNRDGRVGTDGCIFCSEVALLPASGRGFGPLAEQLGAGLAAVERRYGARKAIAYFQDQTATDAPLETLEVLYAEALDHPSVVALAVGTRPDWLPDEVLGLLARLNQKKAVILELGLQTANDELLTYIRRGHSVADFERAVERAHRAGLEVVAHVILDLPGETPGDRADTARCLNRVGVEGVKVHNLHVLRDTELARLYQAGDVSLGTLAAYAAMVVEFLGLLEAGVVVHRLTGEGPASLMLAPGWGQDKTRILSEIEHLLVARDSWQGKHIRSP